MPQKNTNCHLEYKRMGKGSTDIIFLNGFRMKFDNWNRVHHQLTLNNGVLLFNRRGVGASAKATVPQVGDIILADMRSLFSHLGMKPPYIFVAHSLGGLFAQLYARLYPDEIAGGVFVDTPHPSEVAEQRRMQPPWPIRVINDSLKTIEKLFDRYKYSEDECIEETIHQIQDAGSFPNVPIAVVSGTKKMPFVPEEAFTIHQRYQTELLRSSSNTTQHLCNASGHFPQITEPKKVITAIRDIVHKSTTK